MPTTISDVQAAACDLCGETRSAVLAEAEVTRNRTVACPRCSLIYAWPRPSETELHDHYESEFRGDAGSRQRASVGNLDPRDVRREESRARQWALKIVHRVLDPRGKEVLDLRSRTGALAAALGEAGARVLAVDPFQANVEYSLTIRGLSRAMQFPLWRFHELPGADESYELITALTEHVPGHVMHGARFFERLFCLLKPGGYLVLDEKDVLRPARIKAPSLLDTGPAHLYHLTQHTLSLYLRRAGFEVVECGIDRKRKSVSRHIVAVGRRPTSESPRPSVELNWTDGPTIAAIRRRLWWSQQRWRLKSTRRMLTSRLRRAG